MSWWEPREEESLAELVSRLVNQPPPQNSDDPTTTKDSKTQEKEE